MVITSFSEERVSQARGRAAQGRAAIDDSAADASIAADAVSAETSSSATSTSATAMCRCSRYFLRIPAGSSWLLSDYWLWQVHTGAPHLADVRGADGALLIDGRPVRDYPLAVLRRNIGMVSQETFLFSETIRENLLRCATRQR